MIIIMFIIIKFNYNISRVIFLVLQNVGHIMEPIQYCFNCDLATYECSAFSNMSLASNPVPAAYINTEQPPG